MSYTRSYRETITVSGSKTVSVSYPASQNGGSTSATVYYTEDVPVNVNIDVDTNPFDDSVENCNANVNLLTGAVVATETAQIASIDKNSKQIANTIISGFFGYIRSEISQQVSELSQSIDAHLMHLSELAQSCLSKQKQMQNDYVRISGRYAKIFEDLNNELSSRIHELDKHAFKFKKESDSQKIRSSENDMVSTVSVFGMESADLQSKVSASIAKKRAFDTINKTKVFLWQQKKLNTTVQQSMQNESISCFRYIPVCYFESNSNINQTDKKLYTADIVSSKIEDWRKNEILDYFSINKLNWDKISVENSTILKSIIHSEINNRITSNDPHAIRVKNMIQKIANLNEINVIKN